MSKNIANNTEKQIGFIQGVIYAASLMATHDTNAQSILEESGITVEEIKKYGVEEDIEVLKIYFDSLSKK